MWRGLILNRAVQQFLEDVHWGDLDYLLIDMPPGTGDVQMGLARMLPRTDLSSSPPRPGRPEGGGPGGRHGPQGLPAGGRRDREHERLHLRRTAPPTPSSAAAAGPAWPPSSACRWSDRCRSSRRWPWEATPASPAALGGPGRDRVRGDRRTHRHRGGPADRAGRLHGPDARPHRGSAWRRRRLAGLCRVVTGGAAA